MKGDCGVYEIRNPISGHRYVGSSLRMATRFSQHQSLLKKGRHYNPALQRAWDQGIVLRFRRLAILEESEQLPTEQRLLDLMRISVETNYNIALDAVAWMKGRKHSPETLAAMSVMRKGNRSRTGVPSHWRGKKLSPSHCAAIRRGKAVISDETRAKMRAKKIGYVPWNKGKQTGFLGTDITRDKLRVGALRQHHPELGDDFNRG